MVTSTHNFKIKDTVTRLTSWQLVKIPLHSPQHYWKCVWCADILGTKTRSACLLSELFLQGRDSAPRTKKKMFACKGRARQRLKKREAAHHVIENGSDVGPRSKNMFSTQKEGAGPRPCQALAVERKVRGYDCDCAHSTFFLCLLAKGVCRFKTDAIWVAHGQNTKPGGATHINARRRFHCVVIDVTPNATPSNCGC